MALLVCSNLMPKTKNVNCSLQATYILFDKNVAKIAGLPLTETYDYVFCIGAVFKI